MALYRNFLTIRTPDGPMPVYLVGPGGGEGPTLATAGDVRLIQRPAVVVVPDEGGMHRFDCALADRFANDGYYAAVPDLFHRAPRVTSDADIRARRQGLSDAQVQMDVDATIAYMRAQTYVLWERVGIVGFGMGGRVAYLMAAANPILSVAASFYPEGIESRAGGPSPLEMTAQIRCPVLLFADADRNGAADQDQLEHFEAELARRGVPHEVHRFPGLDQRTLQRSPAADDVWATLLAGFHQYLPRSEEVGKATLLRAGHP